MAEPDRVLSLGEVMKALNLSRATLYRMRAAGKGPPIVQVTERKIGVRASDLQAFLDGLVTQPGASTPRGPRPD
jgi:predicted DNA-binding transcriptional regulator AlpA